MVLFYDDLPPQTAPSPRRKYLRRIVKVTLGLGILLALSLWVLASLGGNSNPLRLGIQDYLTESTGYIAEMKTLNHMSFFPVARLDFTDLSMHMPVKKEDTAADKEEKQELYPRQKTMTDFFDAGDMVASVESAKIAMKFWDMFLTRRRFIELEINKLHVNPGVWLPQALNIESLKVVPEADKAALVAVGTYGAHKLDIRMALHPVKLPNGATLYDIPGSTDVTINVGSLAVEGMLHASSGRTVALDIRKMTVEGVSFSGSASFENRGQQSTLKLDLKAGHSHVQADIDSTPTDITGTITFPVLDMRDLEPVRTAYRQLRTLWDEKQPEDKVAFGTHNKNIDIVIGKLTRDQQEWGNAKAQLSTKPYELHLKNVMGLIGGGALKGDLAINATGKVPTFKGDFHLRGWDYARLQSSVTGQADTHLVLSAEGKTFDDLHKNLKGEILTVAGAGELSGNSALYWGGGLLNAMLPGFSAQEKLKVNCVVADLDIGGGEAKVQTLFMDLSDLTIRGEGAMRISDMMLDMQLKPYPKEASIIDTGVAVTLRGTLADPKITPEKWSVGKKLGGLFLGTINPAFFAFSLTDLGLNEDHPCHAYIKQP